jgi:hypothetical protein
MKTLYSKLYLTRAIKTQKQASVTFGCVTLTDSLIRDYRMNEIQFAARLRSVCGDHVQRRSLDV